MLATGRLIEEHQTIKAMLEVLEAVCKKLEAGAEVPAEHLNESVEFIRGFADKFHHAKEEDLLFPAMEEVGIPNEGGPIGVMLMEHEAGRNFVRQMAAAGANYGRGDQDAMPQYVENARNYIRLLWGHIDKEDNILYKMADAHLSREKQDELLQAYILVEEEKFGSEKLNRFYRILRNLQKLYL